MLFRIFAGCCFQQRGDHGSSQDARWVGELDVEALDLLGTLRATFVPRSAREIRALVISRQAAPSCSICSNDSMSWRIFCQLGCIRVLTYSRSSFRTAGCITCHRCNLQYTYFILLHPLHPAALATGSPTSGRDGSPSNGCPSEPRQS